MNWSRYYCLLLLLLALGCNRVTPQQHVQAWMDSWAEMGIYLPDQEQIDFFRINFAELRPELNAALSHGNPDIRQRAAYVIGMIGPDAVVLGPALLEQLAIESEQTVRIYLVDALAAVRFREPAAIELLKTQYASLSSENVPPDRSGGYAEVDEKINLSAALFLLSKPDEREPYLSFVIQWLHSPDAKLKRDDLAGYWERRWMAVISLEEMRGAIEAIPLLESMMNEQQALPWVAVHVPRVIKFLKSDPVQ